MTLILYHNIYKYILFILINFHYIIHIISEIGTYVFIAIVRNITSRK